MIRLRCLSILFLIALLTALTVNPAQSQDDFMTYRFMMSADGGSNWSDIMGAGDHGMWTGEGDDRTHAWNEVSNNFTTIVDAENNLHIIAVLDQFNPNDNPLNRQNGIYDIKTDAEGNVTYTMIFGGELLPVIWLDAGMDENGHLYLVFSKPEIEANGTIRASKSSNNGNTWSDPVLLIDLLSPANIAVNMTSHVGEYFWVLYQAENFISTQKEYFTMKVSADLSEISPPDTLGFMSEEGRFSRDMPTVNAIDQDVAEGYVTFAVFESTEAGTRIGTLRSDQNEWTYNHIMGRSWFPSIMMYPDMDEGGTPFIFASFDPPAVGGMHHNWFSYASMGYGSDSWHAPAIIDTTVFDGVRSLLASPQGVMTATGRIVVGTNIWGQIAPEGFTIAITDVGGRSWSNPRMIWSIFNDGLKGGSLSQCQLIAGQENTLWAVFAGRYGETDFTPPVVENVTLSSYMLNGDWNVTVDVMEDTPEEPEVMIYWTMDAPLDPATEWDFSAPESSQPGEDDFVTYLFSIPSDTILGGNLMPGDSVWFFISAMDETNNIARTPESLIIVNTGWLGLKEPVVLPNRITLGQNYPNPFNSETSVPFSLAQTAMVKMSLYDLSGRLVETLWEGYRTPGNHVVTWNSGYVRSGIYFYTLETGDQRYIGKLTLLR